MDFTSKEKGPLSNPQDAQYYYYQPAQPTPTPPKSEAPKASTHKPITDLQDIKTDISLLEELLGIKNSLDEARTEIWSCAVKEEDGGAAG
ncbi:hypothetical protein G7Y79_00055g089700 [Physcia stellaris]|nr:hypothetical protein G7Y79_00055g089700 [Physcia stellaris]